MRRTGFLALALAALALVLQGHAASAEALMIMEPPPPRFDPRVLGAVVSLPSGPPPISGGTLAMLPDGHRVVVSDPDRDRVLVVDVDGTGAPRVEALPAGSEPGRIAIDGAGRAHVVLRGRGELLSLDPVGPADDHGTRRGVCPMPRGVAFDACPPVLE